MRQDPAPRPDERAVGHAKLCPRRRLGRRARLLGLCHQLQRHHARLPGIGRRQRFRAVEVPRFRPDRALSLVHDGRRQSLVQFRRLLRARRPRRLSAVAGPPLPTAGRHVAGGRDQAAHRRGDDLVSIAGKTIRPRRACRWTSTGGTSKWPRCAAAGTIRRPCSSASRPARTRSITSISTSVRSCSMPWASAGPSIWGPTTTTCPATSAPSVTTIIACGPRGTTRW